jgi:hypothetical protein
MLKSISPLFVFGREKLERERENAKPITYMTKTRRVLRKFRPISVEPSLIVKPTYIPTMYLFDRSGPPTPAQQLLVCVVSQSSPSSSPLHGRWRRRRLQRRQDDAIPLPQLRRPHLRSSRRLLLRHTPVTPSPPRTSFLSPSPEIRILGL